ncbi:RNA polymerase sigma factor SigJ [Marinibacterium anthonyi]|nr:RNA polymerase sigma factor SigJ [Marinibacterium anthonyi]
MDPAFAAARPQMLRLAFRMLGSHADAEDVVQEAWVKWASADRSGVREPMAFLRTMVTRLCLNELASARRRRETYVGPWLPEPWVDGEGGLEDITLSLMVALESLSPLERAAFLLGDVFGLGIEEVAQSVGRSEAACRQLASRARRHLRDARPRYAVDRAHGLEMAMAFFNASRAGDLEALQRMLAEDVVAAADGGGRVSASLDPLAGRDAVLARHVEMARGFVDAPSVLLRLCPVGGLPGFVTREAGEVLQTTALEIAGDRIAAIYVTRNPEKLRAVRHALG